METSAIAAEGHADSGSASSRKEDHCQITGHDVILVQHLIEKCLLFYMDREECVACLRENAKLKPEFVRIVWDELEKCNVEFFAAYHTTLMRRREKLVARHLAQCGNQCTKLRQEPAAMKWDNETDENARFHH